MDITREVQAQQSLENTVREMQALRDQFQLALNTIPGLVWSALPDGYIDYLNRRWLEYTGMTLQQACGWGWRAAIHPDDLPGLERYWRSVLASGKSGETEARLRRFDGAQRWFLFRGVPLYDETGTLVKWYGQTTDIDDRKGAEALLAGENRILEMIAKSSSLAETLAALCRLIEVTMPGTQCGIMLVDQDQRRLQYGAGPGLPPDYNAAIHGRPVNLDAGPCGMAAYLKRQVIAADVAITRLLQGGDVGPVGIPKKQ